MASRANSTDPRAERVREQMKRAALELIRERRVEDIAVSAIVTRAGVSRPVFYQHFDDRDDAIATALDDEFDAVIDGVGEEPDAVIDALLRYAADNAELYFNLYPSIASQRSAQAFREHLRPVCRAIVAEHTEETDASPEAMTTFLLGGLMEVLTEWAASRGGGSPAAEVESLLGTFRSMMAR